MKKKNQRKNKNKKKQKEQFGRKGRLVLLDKSCRKVALSIPLNLTIGKYLLIGSSSSCNLKIVNVKSVSAEHCKIFCDKNDSVYLQSLSSTFPIFLPSNSSVGTEKRELNLLTGAGGGGGQVAGGSWSPSGKNYYSAEGEMESLYKHNSSYPLLNMDNFIIGTRKFRYESNVSIDHKTTYGIHKNMNMNINMNMNMNGTRKVSFEGGEILHNPFMTPSKGDDDGERGVTMSEPVLLRRKSIIKVVKKSSFSTVARSKDVRKKRVSFCSTPYQVCFFDKQASSEKFARSLPKQSHLKDFVGNLMKFRRKKLPSQVFRTPGGPRRVGEPIFRVPRRIVEEVDDFLSLDGGDGEEESSDDDGLGFLRGNRNIVGVPKLLRRRRSVNDLLDQGVSIREVLRTTGIGVSHKVRRRNSVGGYPGPHEDEKMSLDMNFYINEKIRAEEKAKKETKEKGKAKGKGNWSKGNSSSSSNKKKRKRGDNILSKKFSGNRKRRKLYVPKRGKRSNVKNRK